MKKIHYIYSVFILAAFLCSHVPSEAQIPAVCMALVDTGLKDTLRHTSIEKLSTNQKKSMCSRYEQILSSNDSAAAQAQYKVIFAGGASYNKDRYESTMSAICTSNSFQLDSYQSKKIFMSAYNEDALKVLDNCIKWKGDTPVEIHWKIVDDQNFEYDLRIKNGIQVKINGLLQSGASCSGSLVDAAKQGGFRSGNYYMDCKRELAKSGPKYCNDNNRTTRFEKTYIRIRTSEEDSVLRIEMPKTTCFEKASGDDEFKWVKISEPLDETADIISTGNGCNKAVRKNYKIECEENIIDRKVLIYDQDGAKVVFGWSIKDHIFGQGNLGGLVSGGKDILYEGMDQSTCDGSLSSSKEKVHIYQCKKQERPLIIRNY